jgi:hypothetical protein
MAKVNNEQRRAIARAAVHAKNYGDIAQIARTYSISRTRVYQIRSGYLDLQKLERLEDEVSFRRELISEKWRGE